MVRGETASSKRASSPSSLPLVPKDWPCSDPMLKESNLQMRRPAGLLSCERLPVRGELPRPLSTAGRSVAVLGAARTKGQSWALLLGHLSWQGHLACAVWLLEWPALRPSQSSALQCLPLHLPCQHHQRAVDFGVSSLELRLSQCEAGSCVESSIFLWMAARPRYPPQHRLRGLPAACGLTLLQIFWPTEA